MIVIAYTAAPYGAFLLGLGASQFDFSSDTFKVALTTSSYSPNVNTHEFFSSVTNEVTGTGYTAGGVTLAGLSWAYDSTNLRAVLSATAVTWTGATFTAHRAVVYKSTGSSATSRLVGYIDFGVDKVYASEDCQLSFPNGVVRIRSV